MELDCVPPELLILVWALVEPLLLNSLYYVLETGSFHRDQKQGPYFSFKERKEKDPFDYSKFRPSSSIWFINVDVNVSDVFLS